MKRTFLWAMVLVILISIASCSYFQKDKEDNTLMNIGLLSILRNQSATTSTSECSGSSGMVICIPKGIAQ